MTKPSWSYRGTRCSALLNAYPYTNGHLLVLPNRAVEELSELDADEMVELWSVVRDGVAALRAAYGCDGVERGHEPGCRRRARGCRNICTPTCCPVGTATPASRPPSPRPGVLPEALDASWQKLRTAWPAP